MRFPFLLEEKKRFKRRKMVREKFETGDRSHTDDEFWRILLHVMHNKLN